MPRSPWLMLVLVFAWSSTPRLSAARPGRSRGQAQTEHPGGVNYGHTDGGGGGLEDPAASLGPELDFLADFAGKKRLWVVTAPSHSDHYLRLLEKQLQDAEQEGLHCRLAERDTFILTIIQNAMMEGTLLRTTLQGGATTESMDPDTVSKILHYLELTTHDQAFSMLILKKNLRVSERFPYPVRVEAILEIIDQLPMRKLERMTRKGSPQKCKVTKKRLVKKKVSHQKRKVFSPLRQGNVTTALLLQSRAPLDKKEALKSKIQDILSGRSRFIIRKTPARPRAGQGLGTSTNSEGEEPSSQTKVTEKDRGVSAGKEGVKSNSYVSGGESSAGARRETSGISSQGKPEENRHAEGEPQEKNSSKKKGKGKKEGKGKKGKGRGKSNRETSEKDKKAMNEFVEALKGNRRLLVVTSPSSSSPQYVQQRENNDLHYCDLALRKVTMATILDSGHQATLTLQHYQLDSEPAFSSLPEQFSDPDLISQLRSEFSLSSQDFSMTITDYDLKPTRVLSGPPAPPALLEYIDGFPSRRVEKEKERKAPVACSKTQEQSGAPNSLLRFMSKRRLLIISTPSKDDYSFQQQLRAFTGQECPMGIRHFALLKLVGVGAAASGSVELFPLNGRSQTEVEPLSGEVVEGLRGQLKIRAAYFSMLVVGKDGEVKTWFPSPMWSLDSIYDLVDSMELRLQEERLQRSLGISCPNDASRDGAGGVDGSYYGYEEERREGYMYHQTQD
ncbi:coiled-coil domain-containing protein 80 [Osmerus eperlanus]|uniref:coiled-coil domain-containing protein 80 n=1 Tax=Osmerus eperlanus TaxID=29151 RepID=UPI002E0EA1B8